MKTRVSNRGQILLPVSVRRKLGLRAGDALNVRVEAGRIVLTPRKKRLQKARIVVDPITGLPVLTAGHDAPVLTSKQVEDILSNAKASPLPENRFGTQKARKR